MKYWLLLLVFVASFNSNAADTEYFVTAESSATELAALQQQAREQDKLLMFVLGADWCHDSRDLMAQFQQPEFAAALEERYVMQAIDVGYLEYGFFITNAFGAPTYYGTPTVIIVDPDSGRILNKADWQQWTNASSQTPETYQDYFIEQQFTQVEQTAESLAFETAQAERVRDGFATVGPMLKTYMTSDDDQASSEFGAAWEALAAFRNGVFEDVVKYQSATAGFPDYPRQMWEPEKE